jgi:hypothetical protein
MGWLASGLARWVVEEAFQGEKERTFWGAVSGYSMG